MPSDRATPARSADRIRRWLPWLEFAALLVFVASRASGHADHVDFHMEDEWNAYVRGGRELVRTGTLPALSYSAVSTAVYGLLSLLPIDAWPLADAMYWLCVLAAPVSLWWAVRVVLTPAAALLLAAWLGSSVRLLQADCSGGMAIPHVYAFNAALVFVALGACLRHRPGLGLGVLVVAAINRQELAPWALAFGALLAARSAAGWSARQRAGAALASLVPAIAVLLDAETRHRSWLAFQQNYAHAAVLAEANAPGLAPEERARRQLLAEMSYADPGEVVARRFPTATSVPTALLENPLEFGRHVGCNLAALPLALVAAQSTTVLPPPLPATILAGLAVAAIWTWRRRRPSASPAAPRLPRPVGWLLATSPLAVAVPMFVAARSELWWPLFPAWSLPLCLLLPRAAASSAPKSAPRFVAVALLLGIATAVPGPFAATPERRPENREARALLLAHPPPPAARMVCAWHTHADLIDRRDLQTFVAAQMTPAALAAFAAGQAGDRVLVTPGLVRQVPDWPAVQRALTTPTAWRELGRRGDVVLYERVGERR